MVLAAIVEAARLAVVRDRDLWDTQNVPLSVFWLIPQYFIIGAAEIMVRSSQQSLPPTLPLG